MSKREEATVPSQTTRDLSMYIAMVVRNAMEDFHRDHLSDAQMKELNMIIRNAICTALHTADLSGRSAVADSFIDLHARQIPDYWEPPQLLDAFVRNVKASEEKRRKG